MKTNKYQNVSTLEEFWNVANKSGDKKRYPYACDAVAFYIYGDQDRFNLVPMLARGEYGHNRENCLVDECGLSELMLECELSWKNRMKDLNTEIAAMNLVGGATVSEVF